MKRCVILLAMLSAFSTAVRADSPAATAAVFETNVLCVRVAHLTDNFPAQFQSLQPASRPAGTVLDLRFADGDSSAVEASAKIFAAKKSPLVILVNGQTLGGAAELAARLRADKLGVVIGSTNAPGKISPDIAVNASAADERKFLANPFALAATNSHPGLAPTNDVLAFIDHMSEAELVRKRIKDGEDSADEALMPRAEPAQPVIRDPALARAVDLLKALALLKPSRG